MMIEIQETGVTNSRRHAMTWVGVSVFGVVTSAFRGVCMSGPPAVVVERRKKKKKTKVKIVVNLSNCKYDVVKTSGESLGWDSVMEEEDPNWNLFWIDTGVSAERLMRLKRYQKINHFPGMSTLARKARMGKTLNRMLVAHPKDYKFFPQTWSLPAEWTDFFMQFSKGKTNRTYIVKPDAGCQGRGIFLTRTYENVSNTEPLVVQRYLTDPYLIDGLKFDMRVYIVVTSCDPLRIYMFKDGLVRLCTEPYVVPTAKNLAQVCMHLTNYAINKGNSNFVFNSDAERTDIGNKRSIQWFFTYLEANGHDPRAVWDRIGDMITKTLIAAQPSLQSVYRSCVSADDDGFTCFEVLGFDIMLDSKLRPWLIEVNHSPSFTCDTPFDHKIKSTLVTETMQLIRMTEYDKKKMDAEAAAEAHGRLYSGATRTVAPPSAKLSPAEAREAVLKAVSVQEKKRFEWFARVYPPLEFEEMSQLLELAAVAGVVAAASHLLVHPEPADYSLALSARKEAYRAFMATSREQFDRGITSKAQAMMRGRLPVVSFGTVVGGAGGPPKAPRLTVPAAAEDSEYEGEGGGGEESPAAVTSPASRPTTSMSARSHKRIVGLAAPPSYGDAPPSRSSVSPWRAETPSSGPVSPVAPPKQQRPALSVPLHPSPILAEKDVSPPPPPKAYSEHLYHTRVHPGHGGGVPAPPAPTGGPTPSGSPTPPAAPAARPALSTPRSAQPVVYRQKASRRPPVPTKRLSSADHAAAAVAAPPPAPERLAAPEKMGAPVRSHMFSFDGIAPSPRDVPDGNPLQRRLGPSHSDRHVLPGDGVDALPLVRVARLMPRKSVGYDQGVIVRAGLAPSHATSQGWTYGRL